MGCDIVTDKELVESVIQTYCDLQRIKKFQKEENPELEYQLKVAKAKLSAFGVNIQELEY